MNSSLEWIEAHTRPLNTVEQVRAFLAGLHERLSAEADEATGKERWRLKGEAFGVSMAIQAMRDLEGGAA